MAHPGAATKHGLPLAHGNHALGRILRFISSNAIAARYAAPSALSPGQSPAKGMRRHQGWIIDGSALTSSKTTSDVGAVDVSPSCRYPIGFVPSDWVPVS